MPPHIQLLLAYILHPLYDNSSFSTDGVRRCVGVLSGRGRRELGKATRGLPLEAFRELFGSTGDCVWNLYRKTHWPPPSAAVKGVAIATAGTPLGLFAQWLGQQLVDHFMEEAQRPSQNAAAPPAAPRKQPRVKSHPQGGTPGSKKSVSTSAGLTNGFLPPAARVLGPGRVPETTTPQRALQPGIQSTVPMGQASARHCDGAAFRPQRDLWTVRPARYSLDAHLPNEQRSVTVTPRISPGAAPAAAVSPRSSAAAPKLPALRAARGMGRAARVGAAVLQLAALVAAWARGCDDPS